MIYIIWLTLLSLSLFTYFTPEVPFWVPMLAYFLVLAPRIKEKIGNHQDWVKESEQNEKIELEKIHADLQTRRLLRGGTRIKKERRLKDKFEYQRKKEKRKFETDMIDSFFLK